MELSSFEFDEVCRGKEELLKLAMATRSFKKAGEIGIKDRQGEGQLRRLYRLSPANFTGILKSRRLKMPRFALLTKAEPRNIR